MDRRFMDMYLNAVDRWHTRRPLVPQAPDQADIRVRDLPVQVPLIDSTCTEASESMEEAQEERAPDINHVSMEHQSDDFVDDNMEVDWYEEGEACSCEYCRLNALGEEDSSASSTSTVSWLSDQPHIIEDVVYLTDQEKDSEHVSLPHGNCNCNDCLALRPYVPEDFDPSRPIVVEEEDSSASSTSTVSFLSDLSYVEDVVYLTDQEKDSEEDFLPHGNCPCENCLDYRKHFATQKESGRWNCIRSPFSS